MDFYGTGPAGTGYNFASQIDMRAEIHKVLFGASDFVAQGQLVVLREFNDVQCPGCWNVNQGGSSDPNCVYCQGEGYQFTERFVTAAIFAGVAPVYKPSILGTGQYPVADYGDTDPNRYTGYVEWNTYLNYQRYTVPQFETPDKLYQLVVGPTGKPVTDNFGVPLREAKWKLLSITPIRGDQGRIEYFELGMMHEVIS